MEYVLEAEGLTKRYGAKLAVNGLSLKIKKGQVYGLIGRNGAGKTTLMRMILGMCTPTKGRLRLYGSDNLDEQRKAIGSLIEAPGLYNNCTARENMLAFATLLGVGKEKVDELLEFVGLADAGNKRAGQFSLGMRQRLGIAIALLGDPELLILDEPVNALDPAGIKEIRDLILRLKLERGVSFMISSHLLDELSRVVDVWGIINNGILVDEISAVELELRCGEYAVLRTNDNDEAAELIARDFGDIRTERRGDGLYVYDVQRTAQINRLLVSSGIDVYEIRLSVKGVEDFFIERLGSV